MAIGIAIVMPISATAVPAVTGDAASTRLVVRVHDGDGTTRRWVLRCDPPGGSHPRPARACRELARLDDPFAPRDPELMCTQVYGGPERARVTGTWRGERVQRSFDRADGCGIAEWQERTALLGRP